MGKPKEGKVSDLELSDSPPADEYVVFQGKSIRTHHYKNVDTHEPEASNWKVFEADMEREQKEAKDFFAKRDADFSYGEKCPKPVPEPKYTVTWMPDGSAHVVPYLEK
jgi:hypothetical protein